MLFTTVLSKNIIYNVYCISDNTFSDHLLAKQSNNTIQYKLQTLRYITKVFLTKLNSGLKVLNVYLMQEPIGKAIWFVIQ